MEAFNRRLSSEHPVRRHTLAGIGEVWGRELDFDIIEEPWARYRLKDLGFVVRNRVVALRIVQVMDQNPTDPSDFAPRLNGAGEPMISVDFAPMMVVSY